ncbi:MAG TPA: NAD(P)-binding domain-containing protein [Terriglobales bacterium]|jgi:putative YpdA family bacillithiol system oxidoreductase
MENLITILVATLISVFFVHRYFKGLRLRDEEARASAEKGKLFSEGPKAQHPNIDILRCIGCATCTMVCPEGDVLAMIGGKAAIVNGYKCIGHGICAEACPVGAIEMVVTSPSMAADMPWLTPEFETSVGNMYIAGELTGLALIKNAVNQGRDCIDTIASRKSGGGLPASSGDILDVLIVGAGPAGISASLRAAELKLNYLTLEQDEIGGTVAKYPRQKLVMTSPVQFPMYGKFKKTELSKENLLEFWNKVLNRADFKARTGEKVTDISKNDDVFTVATAKSQFRSHAVVLALGRTGSPRKLGVKGEELPKVMYRLIEADHYHHKRILVVGGGDSAMEAAMGLAHQPGNKVTLSYRQQRFSRVKDRNLKRLEEYTRNGKVEVLFSSQVTEIRETSVSIDVAGTLQEIENDYVWVFAGGIAPYEFLKKVGVRMGVQDTARQVEQQTRESSLVQLQPQFALAEASAAS